MTSLRLPAVAMFAGVLFTPLVTFADSRDQPPTKVVRFSDLDLSTHRGVEVLYRRIVRAAHEVCGPVERPGSLLPGTVWQTCMRNALMSAVHSVDRPLLTAYYEEHDNQRVHFHALISTIGK